MIISTEFEDRLSRQSVTQLAIVFCRWYIDRQMRNSYLLFSRAVCWPMIGTVVEVDGSLLLTIIWYTVIASKICIAANMHNIDKSVKYEQEFQSVISTGPRHGHTWHRVNYLCDYMTFWWVLVTAYCDLVCRRVGGESLISNIHCWQTNIKQSNQDDGQGHWTANLSAVIVSYVCLKRFQHNTYDIVSTPLCKSSNRPPQCTAYNANNFQLQYESVNIVDAITLFSDEQ